MSYDHDYHDVVPSTKWCSKCQQEWKPEDVPGCVYFYCPLCGSELDETDEPDEPPEPDWDLIRKERLLGEW